MTAKKTIILDLDSIIVAIDEAWYPEYNRRYNDDLRTEDITEWAIHKFCRQDLLQPADGAAFTRKTVHPVYSIIEEPGFFRKPKPIPGAVEGVKRLVDAGHRVVILSAGMGPHSLTDKALWVQDHLPFFDLKNLMLSHVKDIVHGDIVFDDGPHNITAFRNAQPNIRIATISYPYNMPALSLCDLVAGSYLQPQLAWYRFVKWVEDGAPSRKEMTDLSVVHKTLDQRIISRAAHLLK